VALGLILGTVYLACQGDNNDGQFLSISSENKMKKNTKLNVA
jgi:hypothetical protein